MFEIISLVSNKHKKKKKFKDPKKHQKVANLLSIHSKFRECRP